MRETTNIALAPDQPSIIRVVLICTAIALGGIIFGYDTGSISGMVNMTKYIEAVGDLDKTTNTYSIPTWRSGLIVAGVSMGGLFGSFGFGKVADRYGRKWALVGCAAIINVAVVIQAAAYQSWPAVFIGRCVGGLSIGGLSAICPMYLSETAPSHMRALLVSMFQFLITVGIFLGQTISLGCSYWDNSNGQFLVPLLSICVFAVAIICAVSLFVPESARYLISKDRVAEARQSLAKVMNIPINAEIIEQEIIDVQRAVEADRSTGESTWRELFSHENRILYRVVLGVAIMMLQQLSGVNYFFYYGTSLFKAVSNMNPFGTSMILGGVNVVGTICFLPIISKYPRRIVLMMGSAAMFVAFILFACIGSFALYDDANNVKSSVGGGMIALACIFIVAFAGTWAPVSFVVISEMFPQRIRSKAISLAVASNWLVNTGITFLTPTATEHIGYKFGFVFSFFTFISIFVVYFFVYETKGHTLENIEVMFMSGISARQSSSWEPLADDSTEIKDESSYNA
ncbi:uncharacterized protein SAPINGB_P001148 [Magnusiomyces paraingens]|uniref:Major facilitator superfamily (MFS) profile domain-containing protein n=1 Tax=Magnusiomyces paraingens TaxID=2606893 RepID=A0A5E8B623_9ASCO|nr:uncharacterized protein SAPINGB_P001148 [Saprochaete ingens]VVT46306.1 unnamed protein product [Saprochaete ingens]